MTEEAFIALAHDLDRRVQAFETHPAEEVRALGMDLLQAVDALHRAALARLVRAVSARDPAGWAGLLAEDPVVRLLLALYDLLPGEPRFQAEAALTEMRAYIRSHGGDVEILDVTDGVVRLRLTGACLECPALNTTLRQGIGAALQSGLPGFKEIRVA